MTIKIDQQSVFVFDLDDTLFREVDYLRSAYRQIAGFISETDAKQLYEEMFSRYSNKENVFDWVLSKYGNLIPDLKKETLLKMYREHIPEIKLSDDTRIFLNKLKAHGGGMGLITDGRSVTQRNKLKALQVLDLFNDLVISEEFGSEKPNPANYRFFEEKYPGRKFYFFGDNTIKDFIIPVQLGWTSICIKDAGENIHAQDFSSLSPEVFIVDRLSDIELI